MTDIHTLTAAEVFGVPEEQVTKGQRQAAKATTFHALYGRVSGTTDISALRAAYATFTRPTRQESHRGVLRSVPFGLVLQDFV